MKSIVSLGSFLLLPILFLLSCAGQTLQEENHFIKIQNPILPGYFVDPSIVEKDGIYYLYVTSDPWGTEFLACWESDDFVNWIFNTLNWPTKEVCTTPLSGSAMV